MIHPTHRSIESSGGSLSQYGKKALGGLYPTTFEKCDIVFGGKQNLSIRAAQISTKHLCYSKARIEDLMRTSYKPNEL